MAPARARRPNPCRHGARCRAGRARRASRSRRLPDAPRRDAAWPPKRRRRETACRPSRRGRPPPPRNFSRVPAAVAPRGALGRRRVAGQRRKRRLAILRGPQGKDVAQRLAPVGESEFRVDGLRVAKRLAGRGELEAVQRLHAGEERRLRLGRAGVRELDVAQARRAIAVGTLGRGGRARQAQRDPMQTTHRNDRTHRRYSVIMVRLLRLVMRSRGVTDVAAARHHRTNAQYNRPGTGVRDQSEKDFGAVKYRKELILP